MLYTEKKLTKITITIYNGNNGNISYRIDNRGAQNERIFKRFSFNAL